MTLAIPPELVAAIDEAVPDDPGPRLVAADWLQQRGEVHGELIAAAIDGRAANAAHIAALQARVAPSTAAARWTIGWRWGFIERIAYDDPGIRTDLATLAELLALPAACALRSLAIHDLRFFDAARLADTLALLPPTVRELQFADTPGHADFDLSPVLARLPRLETLGLASTRVHVGALHLEHLVELELRRAERAELAASWLPRLTALRFASIRDDASRLDALTSDRFPSLERLAVSVYGTPPENLAALPIAHTQLQSIECIGGRANERDRRRFPLDRDGIARSQLLGLVDLGHHRDGAPGRLYVLDPERGRLTVGSAPADDICRTGWQRDRATVIEHTGFDWWLRDTPAGTRLNGIALSHCRLRAGDTLVIHGHAFRLVGGEAELAAIRARTNLY